MPEWDWFPLSEGSHIFDKRNCGSPESIRTEHRMRSLQRHMQPTSAISATYLLQLIDTVNTIETIS